MMKYWIYFLMISFSTAQQSWVVETSDTDNFVPPTVANGYIWITPEANPLHTRHLIAAGLYDRVSPEGVSRLMRLPNPMNFALTVDNHLVNPLTTPHFVCRLHLDNATYTADFGDENFLFEIRIVPLRNVPQLVIYQLKMTAKRDLSFSIQQQVSLPEEVDSSSLQMFSKEVIDLDFKMKLHSLLAESRYERNHLAWAYASLDADISENKGKWHHSGQLKKGDSWQTSLLFAFASSPDYASPLSQAERMVVYGKSLGLQRLLAEHSIRWNDLWQSDIIIEGDEQAQQAVRLALYNLYASAREGTETGVPPFGLTSNGYNGHIFWDSELWMLPPLLLLKPELAKSSLQYRIKHSEKAQQIAQSFGYQGMMFPWESDHRGEESTPSQFLTGILEHHITADVGIALWDYYLATNDKQWLRSQAFPVMEGIAQFWESRVSLNPDRTYSIKGVVGADEYAHNVTDNAFTNGAVKRFLKNFHQANKLLGEKKFSSKMNDITSKLRILDNFSENITMEYEGYDGRTIKQTDVNMLAFPLKIITDESRIKSDMKYYEKRLDPNGPAMTHAVLSVNYARLGDSEKAYQHFLKAFVPNRRKPFGVLAESASPHSQTQFVTASGGLLQTILFGFAYFDITEKGIIRKKSILPKHWKSLTIKGVGKNKETIVIN